uniref:Uncharacterized protein n=1 Tax=Tetradesmus obliquus TaxID=3088 RepID=A0A383W2Z8_TETOB|eukprot:jgi/Sobl393_1/18081/SZX71036.1
MLLLLLLLLARAVMDLRAAVAADVADPQKEAAHDRKRAQLFADALAGDRRALLQIMTDQTADADGHGDGDDDDDDEFDDDDDMGDDEDDDAADVGLDFMAAMRHGRALGLAAHLGLDPIP